MSSIIQRVLISFYLSDHVPDLIKQCKASVQAMQANSAYANATPSPSSVMTEIEKLEKAEVATQSRAVGTVEARDEQQLVVISKMRQLEAFVQGLADADLPHAAVLITGAMMSVRSPSTRKKAELTATYTPALGLVLLVGRAARGRAYYEWEWSTDEGETWTRLTPTLEAKASFGELTPMTTYAVRFRAITKKGTGAWSAVVTVSVT